MQLSDTFECKKMGCKGFTYNACLIRRQSLLSDLDYLKATPKYAECQSCEQGNKIKAMFPDWKYERNTKRKKPDRVNLKKDKRKRVEQIQISAMKNEGFSDEEISKGLGVPVIEVKVKPFNAKLFLKAQKRYIKTLIKQGKTVEAEHRIELVNDELRNYVS